MSRLRVVYLDHSAVLSGGELAFVNLLPALDVDPLVLLAEDGPLVGRLTAAGVRCDVVPLAPSTNALRRDQVRGLPGRALVDTGRYVGTLARRVRAERADVVHTISLKAHLYGGPVAALARVPLVWSVQDRIAPDYLPGGAVRLVQLAARLFPSAIIANSRATAATIAGHGPAPVVIPPACDLGEPLPAPTGGALTYGLIGRLSPWKGQDVFLRALAIAFPGATTAAGRPVRARLVGSALFGEHDFEAELHRLADELGWRDAVEFRGFRDDVRAELAAIDVVVHASTVPEPFGMVVPEAMAAGRAVVASRAGGPTEIVTPGVDGLLVAPGDPAALAEALRQTADDEARAELASRAPAQVARFRPEVAAAAVAEVYRSVTGPGRRSRRRPARG